ncbi:hypothetical protein [Nitrososphaera sp.]|uniref:hypothetical protein n=1 Tax=Nitrososphaera sp. TaxID=1971748 RepID=UPI0018302172|nr:hypothetical protein [Nitrososphaera sp.]NWG37001.1 hypothetical protein [Nitrososphaera sp.]
MISAVVVFALAFAAMGLLLGYAATYHVVPEHEPPFRTGDSINSTSIAIEESVQVIVDRNTG